VAESAVLTISGQTLRRYILGQQGLWPGRRWAGQAGVEGALRAGAVIQVDPLNVVARSHDIALYGRVAGYDPADLDALLYQQRALFEWGGAVMIHPMAELPYWQVVMARKGQEPRWRAFGEEYGPTIEAVRATVAERGPMGARDFGGETRQEGSFRSKKVAGQALYYLWLTGELMTHSRQNFQRLYDLRQRLVPAGLDWQASPAAADDYLAGRVLREIGVATEKSWRRWLAAAIERPVTPAEGQERLAALVASGAVAQVRLRDDAKEVRFIAGDGLPLLEALERGEIPEGWRPLAATTSDEMVLLAPLEIVSARGRASKLFGFD
jgi:uncharacterized protein YcaQ